MLGGRGRTTEAPPRPKAGGAGSQSALTLAVGTTTALTAAKGQSFLDNLVADFRLWSSVCIPFVASFRKCGRPQKWREIAAMVPIVVMDRVGPSLYAATGRAGHSLGRFRIPLAKAAPMSDDRDQRFQIVDCIRVSNNTKI